MPPKKKGKKKGKKKKKVSKAPTDTQPVIKPEELIPKVTLSIHLVEPLTDALSTFANNIAFEMTVPINTRLEYIREKIQQRHGGAASNITMCINAYNAK